MAVVTLATLVAKARKRADMVNSTFLSDTEWKELVLSGVQALRQRLHGAGQEWERLTAEMDTVPGQALYNLPTDFYRLQALMANRVQLVPGATPGTWYAHDSDATGWIPLFPFELAELPQLLSRTDGRAETASYRLRGVREEVGVMSPVTTPVRKLEIRPTPRQAFTLRLEYLPLTLLNTSDTAPIEGLDGFEEIPVLQAAIYALDKEETSATHLKEWLAREEARLAEVAAAQDMGRPERVVDVYAQQHGTVMDGGPLGYGYGRRGRGWWP